jgi:proton-coupled amino acid transporter
MKINFQNDNNFDPKLHHITLTQVIGYYHVELDIQVYMAMLLLPIMLSCWIRDLKYLVPLSLFANFAMVVGISVTLYYITQELPAPSTREYIAPWSRSPLFFGTVIYAFEGIGLVCEAYKK